MEIQSMSLDSIKPYPENPRFNDEAVPAVAESIRAFGFKQPIVVDRHHVIIAGHTRYKAAQVLELEIVPVLVADLDENQARAYRIADNKTHENSEWLMDKLKNELGLLQGVEFDMSTTGFTALEINNILELGNFDPEDEESQGRLDELKMVICPECGHEFRPKA